jgi:hypothetical protein
MQDVFSTAASELNQQIVSRFDYRSECPDCVLESVRFDDFIQGNRGVFAVLIHPSQ